jgi:hypothetical protein
MHEVQDAAIEHDITAIEQFGPWVRLRGDYRQSGH